jgi:hypothetical protein
MGTGQMLLSIMALVLLGTTIFSVNRNNINQGTILRQTELGIYAVSLATSYVQKASGMDFDENTAGGLVYINIPMPQPPSIPVGTLTAPGSLGIDAGETQNYDNTYDDFDDYKNFVKDTTIRGVDNFHVTADVYYVNQAPPYAKITANITWLKKIVVKVNNTIDRKVITGEKAATDTIQMSYIMSFYK